MKRHVQASLTLLLAACGGSALEPSAVDPDAVPDAVPVEETFEEGIEELTFDASEEPLEEAPPSIDVVTEAGTTVSFAMMGEDSLLIAEGGPETSAPVLNEYIPFAESPRALYEMLAPGQEVPPALAAASERVVAAGNWTGGTGDYQPLPITAGTFCSAFYIETKANASDVDASNRALEQGGMLRTLGFNVANQWSRNDVVGMKGAVCVKEGYVVWTLRGRNCNTCNYYTIWQRSFGDNYWYYAYSYDKNDDFKIVSKVTTSDTHNVFRHRLASCHDYYHRVVWTSYWATSCNIGGAGASHSDGDYEGADPSNIYTSNDWT